MKRLFIHHPLFRILYPAFFGCLVYVLVLLIFGTTRQLTGHFFSAEALLCVGLAYLLSETLRLIVLLLGRLYPNSRPLHQRMLLQLAASFAGSLLVVSAGVSAYFIYGLGYSAFRQELMVLNVVFLVGTLLYNVVFYGIQLLNRYHRERLRQQEALRQKTARQLAHLRQQVNPNRLFHSLENLLSLLPQDPEAADALIHHLAALYRYSLDTRHLELVAVPQEMQALASLVYLRSRPWEQCFTFHPDPHLATQAEGLLMPGSLLQLVDRILDTTLINPLQPFSLHCHLSDPGVVLRYLPNDKLQQPQPLAGLVAELNQAYSFFSAEPLRLQRKYGLMELYIPVLAPQLSPVPAP